MPHKETAALRAVPMDVFPTLGSLNEFTQYAESKLPITDKNELLSLLMSHQNTVLKTLTK